MKNILIVLFGVLLLGACSSPAELMDDRQVIQLSDDELCSYKNNYRSEYRTNAEIARRGLNCNRFHRQCLNKGNKPGTEAMAFCEDVLRDNERLRYDPPYDNFDVFGYGRYGHRHRYGSGVGIGLGF